MDIGEILAKLRRVRQSGPDRWTACCPAHQDRSPSLALRLLPDGRILLHDFGGCDIESITAALGITVSDLFAEPLTRERLPAVRAPFSALDALRCLAAESRVIAFAAADIVEGKPLSSADADRVALATGRISEALEAVHGR